MSAIGYSSIEHGPLSRGDCKGRRLSRIANRLLSGTERDQRLLDRTHQEAMRFGEFVGEQADPPLQPRPEPRDQAKNLVAAHAMRGNRGSEPVDCYGCQELTRDGSAVGQRRGADRRLNNHALGS